MIPIMKPQLPKYELMEPQLREVFSTGMITSGKYVKQFEEKAARYLEVKYTVTAPSCTAGLMVIMSTLPEGSEVVMPAYTFSATYEAARWNNLNPVLVDCDDTCCIDANLVEAAISEKTSAIIAVHMYGTPPDVDKLEQLARKYNLRLFFDSAHAFGTMYKGKHAGGFGDAEVFSLGPTKTMPVGEGGLITTNHQALAERFRLSCTHGHGPHNLDCEVKGINGRLQEVNGVVGIHLLDQLDAGVQRRNEIAQAYKQRLGQLPGVSFPRVPENVQTTYKDFVMFIDPAQFGMDREGLFESLYKEEIQTKRYFFPPVHQLTVAKDHYKNVRLPLTEHLSSHVLALPIFTQMTSEDIDTVCRAVEKAHYGTR